MIVVGAPPLFPSNPNWPEGLYIDIDEHSKEIELYGGWPHPIGELSLGDAVEFPMIGEASQVMESGLDEPYRNQGLGKALYLIAMQEFGPIHPDWTGGTSSEAFRVWKGLQKLPYVSWMPAEQVGVDIKFVRMMGRQIGLYRIGWPNPVPHAGWKTQTYTEWPENWRGVLDQIYWLEEPLTWS